MLETVVFDQRWPPVPSNRDELSQADKAKDKNFWSVHVAGEFRLIVHKTLSDTGSFTL